MLDDFAILSSAWRMTRDLARIENEPPPAFNQMCVEVEDATVETWPGARGETVYWIIRHDGPNSRGWLTDRDILRITRED